MPEGSYRDDTFVPRVVWTGSFNFTLNATNSFENAVVLHDPKIVNAFYQEWGQILALSEPLDSTSAVGGSGISYWLLKNPVDLYRKTRTFVRLCRTSVRVFRLRRKTRSIFIGKLGRSL